VFDKLLDRDDDDQILPKFLECKLHARPESQGLPCSGQFGDVVNNFEEENRINTSAICMN
jgi:hypothetical protein